MSSDDKVERARVPNIFGEEICIILYCISKIKHNWIQKKTDKFSYKKKYIAWERLTANFNTHFGINKVSAI